MSDIIQLLPDSVANQIAAGEVVQRPASAVKELMENAVDAGATKIQVIIKDAGKSLIQVIDNGCGMSITDARMCFERHATSKIRKAEDIFSILTMGFRGEAMASIAAVAQIEMRTRRHEDELGTEITIEGSQFISQEPGMFPEGTSICVKNLFYNIPARRNFLRANSVELKHIIEEFQRFALANSDMHLSLHSDGNEMYHLPKGSVKQRIVHLMGNSYNQKLVPIEEDTSIIKINGFVGKPEYAKKTRGEQYFFVNKRFIRDPYLHHAVLNAYEELLTEDAFPLYVLFIEIDPAHIDVNVHPTKTEIKYQDEKAIYAIIRSAVKRSLGRYNITPSLDFDQETGFSHLISNKTPEDIVPPIINFDPTFNPFNTNPTKSRSEAYSQSLSHARAEIPTNWESLYNIVEQDESNAQKKIEIDSAGSEEEMMQKSSERTLVQLNNRLILCPIKTGLMLIDQQAAHERILYERFLQQLESHKGSSQPSLFPQTITFNPADFELAREILPDLNALGFQLREFGKNTLIVEGLPADIGSNISEQEVIEHLIEGFKNNFTVLKLDKRDSLARTLAKNAAIKAGRSLTMEEMFNIIDQLFACESPNISLSGKQVIVKFPIEDLISRFN